LSSATLRALRHAAWRRKRAFTVLPGRSCHFGIPTTRFLSQFGEARDLRRRDRTVSRRISPQGHTSEQPADFMAIVARSWFPIGEPEVGM
jgi:hypothetical protein